MLKKYMLFIGAFFSIIDIASAMTVDKMFVVSDDKGNGIISVENNTSAPEFIDTSISELLVNDSGELVRVKYDKSNINDWSIILTSNKFVLDPAINKQVGVRAICDLYCANEKDAVFSIELTPMPYVNGEQDAKVNVVYGYSVIYIIPTKSPKYGLQVKRTNDGLEVKNTGNTFLSLKVKYCDIDSPTCNKVERLLAGRKRFLSFEDVKEINKSIKIDVYNHDEKYHKTLNVSKGGEYEI